MQYIILILHVIHGEECIAVKMAQIQLHYFSINLCGWLLPCYRWVNIKQGLNERWMILFSTSFCFFWPPRKTYILHLCICYFVICYVQCSIVHMLQSSGQEWASLCVLFEVFWDLLRHKYLMIHPTFLQRGLEVKELNTKPGVENFDETRLKKLKYLK